MTTATTEQIRDSRSNSKHGDVSIVWCDGRAIRWPTQRDMDTLPVGPVLTNREIETLDS